MIAWRVRCSATNRRGEQCGRWAAHGTNVCDRHGGKAPQVKRSAAARLRSMVPQALDALDRALKSRDDRLASAVAVQLLKFMQEHKLVVETVDEEADRLASRQQLALLTDEELAAYLASVETIESLDAAIVARLQQAPAALLPAIIDATPEAAR